MSLFYCTFKRVEREEDGGKGGQENAGKGMEMERKVRGKK